MGTALKRTVDIVGASLVLLLLAVPLALIAIAIKLTSRGPVVFRHTRVGKDGTLFVPLKFRTMVDKAIEQGSGYAITEDDQRITKIGRILREWSLDEMPQIINVLKGDMSLVGPRPSWPYQVDRYTDIQRLRLRVKPGLTGLAAIRGRNSIPWEQRIELDNWYIDHWSVWLDLKILALTPWKVITKEGVYGEGGTNPDITPEAPPDKPQESLGRD
ncbi:MAG: sugar transferase [Chloroflexi bacterium]|nr:sugar transferase [Chloroflexota bacterium]